MDLEKTLSRFDGMADAAQVDVKAVAALCGCTVSTVWDRARKGTLPKPMKIGGSARWNVGHLRSFLRGEVSLDQAKRPTESKADGAHKIRREAAPKVTAHLDLSLRDYFAAQALAGLLAAGWCEDEREITGSSIAIANDAYAAADAMIAVRGNS